MGLTVGIKNFFKSWVYNEKVVKAGKRLDSSKTVDNFKVDYKILKDFFLSDPVIRSALQTNVDNICTNYYFEAEDDSTEAEEEMERAKRIFYRDNFMEKWRNLAMVQEVFDDTYQEVQPYLEDGEIVFDSFVLDTPSIKIIIKENGEIDYYKQEIQGKDVAHLKPSNIIHYRFNVFGDRLYGQSLIQTVLFSSSIRKFIEKYNGSIFQNHKPRGVWTFPADIPKDIYDANCDSIIESKTDPNKDIFIRGAGVDYKNFLTQQEIDFINGYKEARAEIIIGLGVPPIYLGIPEGSNKANAGEQGEAYDRRVRAKQNAFAYMINTQLMPKLGFQKIKFAVEKSSKRDELRELEIVNRMEGIITLNEAREELGLPELDPKLFPEAEQIWRKGFAPNMDIGNEPDQFNKALKSKKKLKLVRSTRKEENAAIKNFKKFYADLEQEIISKMDSLGSAGRFKKSKLSPEEVTAIITAMFDNTDLAQTFANLAKDQYLAGGMYIASKLNTTFSPHQEELDFLEKYNLDLVKTSTNRELNNIKMALQTAIISNQNFKQIEQAVARVKETATNNAETLVRTEFNRANNMGSLTSMKQSGVKALKYLIVVNDKRTSEICKMEDKKYGDIEKAIPLDEPFTIMVKGKVYSGMAPPFHPNCRTVVAYTYE